MLEILDVIAFSIAEELGILPGDRLVAINGRQVRDLIDYQVNDCNTDLLLEIERSDGEIWEVEVEKNAEDSLGLVLPHPSPMHCGNNCIFCFVHQLPGGMRPTLYVKDEDYRFSYLYGAYITLSNIAEADVARIIEQRLSPLYVSVHATDEGVRERLLGRKAPPILPLIRRLVSEGIVLHTQIVICPGINDGHHLERTYADLVESAPAVNSLALVPVGLTGFRENLPPLRTVSTAEASMLVDWAHARQLECLDRFGSRFVYAADELYLKAKAEIPALDQYEDLPQIENGVGLIASFRHQACEVFCQVRPLQLPLMSVITGVDAAEEVQRFLGLLTEKAAIRINLIVVDNVFFGGAVTVSGLLVGRDILGQLADRELGEVLLLPDVLLRDGENVLLDDLAVDDLALQLNVRVEVFPADPYGLWDILDTLDLEFNRDV